MAGKRQVIGWKGITFVCTKFHEDIGEAVSTKAIYGPVELASEHEGTPIIQARVVPFRLCHLSLNSHKHPGPQQLRHFQNGT